MSKVVIRSTKDLNLIEVVEDLMNELNWQEIIEENAHVVIKLNLNTAEIDKIPSANTSPALTKALCQVILKRTKNITLVEADAYRNTAEESLKNSQTYEIAKELNIEVVNLTHAPTRDVGNEKLGPMPEILLDADVFITMPVIKTHALTYFTGSLKNQWGCVPRYDRIALHQYLDDLLVFIHGLLKPKLCIMDGIIGVEGRGPTNGIPKPLDIILGSRDGVALDTTAMRIAGLKPEKCQHIYNAYKAGLGKFKEEDIEVDSNVEHTWKPFIEAKLDWAVNLMNRLTKYSFFRKYILGVNWIFYPAKIVVNILRKIGIVR